MGAKSDLVKIPLQQIQLQVDEDSDKGSAWIDVIVTIDDADHFLFEELTKDELSDMSANFHREIPTKELPIDFFHRAFDEAAGWMTDARLIDDGNKLQGFVEFTPKATKMIQNKEVRFFSPSFTFRHTDNKGDTTKNVLLGGGITNQPFLTMDPIELAKLKLKKNRGDNMPGTKDKDLSAGGDQDIESLKVELTNEKQGKVDLQKKLDEAEAEKVNLTKERDALKKEKTDLSNGNEKLSAAVKEIRVQLDNQSFDTEFDKLLKEGKVAPGQKEFLRANLSHEKLVEYGKTAPNAIELNTSLGSDHQDGNSLSNTALKVKSDLNLTDEQLQEAQDTLKKCKGEK